MLKRFSSVCLILLMSSMVAGCGIPQGDYDAVLAERDAAQAQVASLQSDLDAINTQIAFLQSDLAATESALTKAESDLVATNAQIAILQSDLDTTESAIAKAESDLVAIQYKIAAREILTLALSGSLPTTRVEVKYDIEYGNVGGIPLLLDMYIPETPIVTPMPAIIYIHGGSWLTGDKDWASHTHQQSLTKHGFLLVSINYRLSGVAKFPAQVEDSKCAVRWLRANAEKYNVDPDRIGVWGNSAGGHLVMMVGCIDETSGLEGDGGWAEYSSRVQAVCSYCGVGDLVSPYTERGLTEGSAVIQFLGGTFSQIPEIYEAASPVNYVSVDDPPLLLVHGDSDQTVAIISSEIMYQAYQEAGLEATLIEVTGAGHGLELHPNISPSEKEIAQIVLVFFIKHLLLI